MANDNTKEPLLQTAAHLVADTSSNRVYGHEDNKEPKPVEGPSSLRIISFNILVGSPISSIIGAPPLMKPAWLPLAMYRTLAPLFGRAPPASQFFHYRQRHRFKLQLAQLATAPLADIIGLQEVFCPRVRAVYREWAATNGYECVPATAADDRGMYYGGRLAMYGLYALFTLIFVSPVRWMLSLLFSGVGLTTSVPLFIGVTWASFFIWLAAFAASRVWFRGSTLECYLMGDQTGLLTLYNPRTVGRLTRWYHAAYTHRGGDPLNKFAPRSYLVTEWTRPAAAAASRNNNSTAKLRLINTHMNMVGGELHRGPQLRELVSICGGNTVQSSSTESYTDMICGDFNTRPTSPEMKILHEASFVSCVQDGQHLDTIFGRQLDHILMRSAHPHAKWHSANVYCHNPPSSDHKAVIALLHHPL